MDKHHYGTAELPSFFNELIDRCFGNPLTEDPATAEWGTDEAGYGWFNTTEKVPKYWDGTQVVTLYGSVTHWTGTTTIIAGQTLIVVAHTLGTIPTIVEVTPTSDLGGRSWHVTNKTTTQFTLNISGMDIANHTFDVRAIK